MVYLQVRKTAVREVKVLRSLRHENIVQLLDVFRQNGKLFLVFEFVDRTGAALAGSDISFYDCNDMGQLQLF